MLFLIQQDTVVNIFWQEHSVHRGQQQFESVGFHLCHLILISKKWH